MPKPWFSTALWFCFLLLCLPISSLGQTKKIDRIEIVSTWGGLGTPQKSQLTVIRKGSEYYAKGKKLNPTAVEALARALAEPVLPRPTLKNLGITQESLNKEGRLCVENCVNGYIARANQAQRQLFFSSYTDPKVAEAQVLGVLRGGWTDDYPGFDANIRFVDGSAITLSSDNQVLFMIPWALNDGATETKTFNAHISTALVPILPSNFTNRRRLNGDGLYEQLATTVLHSIEPEWKRLEVSDQVKGAVDSFARDYEIVSMELNSYHDEDFGTPCDKEPIEKNLHILLRKAHYPDGFALKVILPVEKGDVKNIELFKKNVDSYLELINSVPWLKTFIETGGKPVWLRFVKNRSLSEKGMRSFAADMKALGKSDLAAEVEKVQDKVAVLSLGGDLEYYQSFWLILPDGRSVVWKHYYVSPLPNIKFVGKECAENRSNTTPCVGALISRDGKIVEM